MRISVKKKKIKEKIKPNTVYASQGKLNYLLFALLREKKKNTNPGFVYAFKDKEQR